MKNYLQKKLYFQLDDLIKVKGIDTVRLSNIRQHLTVKTEDAHSENHVSNSHGHTNGFLKNGLNGGPPLPLFKSQRKISSGPVKVQGVNGLVPSTLYDIHELLSAYSSRPVLEEDFNYRRNNRAAVRVATWNLHQFSIEKVQNLGVKEVICRTILENW